MRVPDSGGAMRAASPGKVTDADAIRFRSPDRARATRSRCCLYEFISRTRSMALLANEIERLKELDDQETVLQKKREAFLALLDAVIEALPDALIVTSLDGKIIIFNERAELMFGYHRSEMIGQTVEMLIPERDRVRHLHDRNMYSRFDVNQRARTMGIGLNLVGLHSDGHEFHTEITLARMVVPKGVYVMALIRFAPHVGRPRLPPEPPAPARETESFQ
jgi:protein-histidine pros-kinase